MNLTLNQLQIFLKIVQTRSITRASEELNITQPAVSIQLKNFQDQFDLPLTEVIRKKMYITEFGLEIAETAKSILEQVDSIKTKTLAFKGKLSGKLKISVVSTGKYVMPHFVSTFLQLHPGIELNMDVTNKSKVIESLENNEVDFALVSILPSGLNIEKISLLKNKLYFVGNTGKGDKTGLNTIEMFEKLPIIFRENGSGTRQVIENYIKKKNLKVSNKIELTSNEAVKQAILAGLGYSVMPLIGIKNELLNKELQIIPIDGLPITTDWQLIWMSGKKHTPITNAFLSYLKNEKSTIIAEKFNWYEEY